MTRRIFWTGLSLILLASGLYPQAKPFTIDTITAAPGETASGMIQVPAGTDAGTQIPVTVMHGGKPGPVLSLIAGNHGYEYPPVLALQRLRARIKPSELAGTVVLVHVANMPSFLARTIYYSPIDRKNLNRVYPGRKDGTVSERIAYAITTEVIEKSDYLIDLHCGDGNESLRPYVYLPETGKTAIDAAMRGLALAFGIDHIVLERGRPADPQASIYCSTTAVTRGKPAIIIESGYLGSSDEESTDRILRGITSVMRHVKMLEGIPDIVEHPIYIDPIEVLTSPATGILYWKVERGQTVAKGTLLAVITDFFGKTLAEVRSPFDGVALYIVSTPPISQGEPVAMIGSPKRQAPETSRP